MNLAEFLAANWIWIGAIAVGGLLLVAGRHRGPAPAARLAAQDPHAATDSEGHGPHAATGRRHHGCC